MEIRGGGGGGGKSGGGGKGEIRDGGGGGGGRSGSAIVSCGDGDNTVGGDDLEKITGGSEFGTPGESVFTDGRGNAGGEV